MVECFKEGLYWRGAMHDVSKFLPSELLPYINHFFSKYNSVAEDKKFDFAWMLHQKRNKHHWQWWVLPNEEGALKLLEIPEPYLTEMICDWLGAAKAQGKVSPKGDKYFEVRKWYSTHKNMMLLNEKTRSKIEEIIKWKS